MDLLPRTYPTFARELLVARATLTLADEVGLAVRADRRRLGMSQRRYAAHRGWPVGRVIRLETAAEDLKLGEVSHALDGTGHLLALCHRPTVGPPPPAPGPADAAPPVPVSAAEWPRADLVARVRGGGRRFPAHHETEQVDYPPPWWWAAEATRAGSIAPHWYAPRPRNCRATSPLPA